MLRGKKIAFRVDASLQMGTGHVMRCLTLADALKGNGAECHFICREHPGNLVDFIRDKGYAVNSLPVAEAVVLDTPQPPHGGWLGATQEQDAAECLPLLKQLGPEWLIVDHYALDTRWEAVLKPHCRKLMAIDDLADRPHECDILLDQTLGRDAQDYRARVPPDCVLLCGSKYALLRPEFADLRSHSLRRRENSRLEHVLVAMGGIDKDNATGGVLQAIAACHLPVGCRITVVMGAGAPWLDDVRQRATQIPWPTEVRVNVTNLAQVMADSDLAIGAAGATSWERCCLGLPTIMIVLAGNQRLVSEGLEQAGAALVLPGAKHIQEQLPSLLNSLIASPLRRRAMSAACARVVDGRGVEAVTHQIQG